MKDWPELKTKLLSEIYEEPYQAIEELVSHETIPDEALKFILSLDDNFMIADFLDGFTNFSPHQLQIVEGYIKRNMKNSDRLYVSDLVDFAKKYNFYSILHECLGFINNPLEDSNLILSSIIYVYEKMDLQFVKEIKNALDNVISDKDYFHSCRTAAAFYLFRLTFDNSYLEILIDYLVNGPELNKELMSNLLAYEYNKQNYFAYHNVLRNIIGNKYMQN